MSANTHSLDLESTSSQYADRADTASLSITGDMSIAAWVFRETNGVGFVIASKWNSQTPALSYTFEFNASDNLLLRVSANGSTSTNSISTGTVQVADGYTHVAVTYDASAGTTAFYIDGSASGTGSSQNTSINDNASRFAIGGRTNSSGAYDAFYDGLVDEVVITSDIMSAGEISKLQQGFDASTALDNIAGYWKLNNDYLDETANNNDLTATGSPVFSTTVPFANYATAGRFMDLTSKSW